MEQSKYGILVEREYFEGTYPQGGGIDQQVLCDYYGQPEVWNSDVEAEEECSRRRSARQMLARGECNAPKYFVTRICKHGIRAEECGPCADDVDTSCESPEFLAALAS